MTTTPGLSFRLAGPADVPAVVALVESAYRGEASRDGWTTEADLLDGRRTGADEVEQVLADPASRLVAAERAGELVACCHLARGDAEAGAGAAYFGMFAVSPRLQGGGVGRLLLAEAERLARAEWGAPRLRMQVLAARTDLIAWYERRGYTRTGRSFPFPYGDERFGLPRRDDLRFDELAKPLG